MKSSGEYIGKLRLLRIMIAILDHPYGYTLKQLTINFGVDHSTIKRDLEVLKNAGFELTYDKKYRYAFTSTKSFKALETLLHFTEEDQDMLAEALNKSFPHSPSADRILRKLGSIYDFRKLDLPFLREPYLVKLDSLKQAQQGKKRVVLQGYRSSNSNIVRDRFVEGFHADPEADMLHAMDVTKKGLRHFRISRIERVMLVDEKWEFEKIHIIHPTDPFRIVDQDQVLVHLTLGVGAYNELIERHPLARGHIYPGAAENTFDFQAKVNHAFQGLTNFILGQYHLQIEVKSPESLKTHLRETVAKMKF